MKWLSKAGDFLALIFMIVMVIVTVFPFVYMVLASLMTYSEATSSPPTFIPETFQWSNYKEVFEKAPFLRYFANTIFVSLMITLATLLTVILASFALTSLEFKHKNAVIGLFVMLLMVPYEAIVFTNYQTILDWNLINTYVALIIPFTTSIFYIYYMYNYMKSLSPAYYKAAKIDGASDLEYIRRIMIPMAKPALTTVGILTFISSWNSFLWPLLVTNDKNYRLLSNGLSAFSTESGSEVHLQMAAATITVIPIILIYLVFRKEIIRGVSQGGVKG